MTTHLRATHLKSPLLTTCVATTGTPVAMAMDAAMAVDVAPILAVVMELAVAVAMAQDGAVEESPAVGVDMAVALATVATGHFATEDVTLLAARPSFSKPHLLLK